MTLPTSASILSVIDGVSASTFIHDYSVNSIPTIAIDDLQIRSIIPPRIDRRILSGQTPAELLHLDRQQDGIEQITAALADRSGIQTLNLICTDPEGHLKLGNTELTLFNLDRYGWQFQQWGEAFTSQAQIVFHRCYCPPCPEVSHLFISRLALFTGAFVRVKEYPSQSVFGPRSSLTYQISG
ncbi:MAG: DUF4347 domain-containing protein [Elainella sp. Prado103]|jgi:hypothetical protein|nr:DUF4347 domain-containing protein [Elainella sp. Prado103]